MREQDIGKGIVEKAAWVIGATERTVGQGVRAVGEVEAAAIDRDEASSKRTVEVCQDALWS